MCYVILIFKQLLAMCNSPVEVEFLETFEIWKFFRRDAVKDAMFSIVDFPIYSLNIRIQCQTSTDQRYVLKLSCTVVKLFCTIVPICFSAF